MLKWNKKIADDHACTLLFFDNFSKTGRLYL